MTRMTTPRNSPESQKGAVRSRPGPDGRAFSYFHEGALVKSVYRFSRNFRMAFSYSTGGALLDECLPRSRSFAAGVHPP